MQAHLVQMDIAWEDKGANRAKVERLLASAPVREGDLVVLPEMFDTGFSFAVERTADTDNATLEFCKQLAQRLKITLHGSLTAIGDDGRGRNRAVACGANGVVLAQFDKVHPFSFGQESERFSGGIEVVTYPWCCGDASLTVCPAVCYDLRFPELFRVGLSKGAELIAIGANWPTSRAAHWRALLIARALENQSFVIGVNRVGRDPGLVYGGGSLVVTPTGDVIAEGDDTERVISVEIDPAEVRRWRDKFPAWKDRKDWLQPKVR